MRIGIKGKMQKLAAFCAAGALAVTGLSLSDTTFGEKVEAASAVTVNTSKTYQTIKGFGGMNLPEWTGGDLTDAQRNTAFGNGTGQLGLSMVRIYVSDDSNQWKNAVATAKAAQAKGATVFATPWNPPTSMRETFTKYVRTWTGSGFTNVAKYNQRRLKKSSYQAYAQHLNSFIKYMESNGVNLYSVSIQNEPDYGSDWTWMEPEDCVEFIAKYGKTVTSGTKAKLMSPETFQYNKDYYNQILNNSTAFANTDLFGTHFYGTTRSQMDFPALENCGKDIWMTEVYVPNSDAGSNERFPEALQVSENIHNGLVVGNMSAYVWWYIRRNYSPMNENGSISKRGYVFAQYSKFIRPGSVRLDATEQPNSGVYVSAFKNNQTNQITIVALNNSTNQYNQTFNLSNASIKKINRYRTGQSENLALTQNLSFSGSSFTTQLPGRTVSTFVVDLNGGSYSPVVTQPVTTTAPKTTTKTVVTTANASSGSSTGSSYFSDSFENGVDSWTARGAASLTLSGRTAAEGTNSLLVRNRTSSWNGATKKLGSQFVAGRAYSFGAKVNYFDGNANTTFMLTMQYTDASGNTRYANIATVNASKGSWATLENKNFTIPSGAKNMEVYVETSGTTNNFYIDSAYGAASGSTSVQTTKATTKAATNTTTKTTTASAKTNSGNTGSTSSSGALQSGWFFNDTFENGNCGWTARGGSASVNSSTAYEGSKCFACTNRSASSNGAAKKLDGNFAASTLYSFSVNVKYNDGNSSQKFRLGVQYTDSNGQTQTAYIADATANKGQWKQISNQYFYMPWGGKNFSLFVETESGTNNFYIDQAVGAKQGTYIKGA